MYSILKYYSPTQIQLAQQVKAIISDVDGVLTDGGIIYDDNGVESKKFNAKDGLIVKLLRDSGIKVGVITGRDSQVVKHRCNELKFDFHYHGVKNKLPTYQEILDKLGLESKEVAYLGDDLNDLALVKKSGLGVVPKDAHNYIQEQADLVTNVGGGQGVLRETGDLILASQGLMEDIISRHLE